MAFGNVSIGHVGKVTVFPNEMVQIWKLGLGAGRNLHAVLNIFSRTRKERREEEKRGKEGTGEETRGEEKRGEGRGGKERREEKRNTLQKRNPKLNKAARRK